MKKTVFNVLKFVYFFSAMFVTMTCYAHAYIDPSATTYVIQAVGAVIIALGAVITVFRHKIAAFFKKDKGAQEKREIHFDEEVEDNTDK
ncbi:MAG: hypothetical protein K6G69_02755 [Lachnospiraceae bacterium]|nr:hypothetical protein [Lachnospiraceae bacterium]